jgi:hypothetical protein
MVTSSLETTLSCNIKTFENTVEHSFVSRKKQIYSPCSQKQGCFLSTCPLTSTSFHLFIVLAGGGGGGGSEEAPVKPVSQALPSSWTWTSNYYLKIKYAKSETVTAVTMKTIIYLILVHIYRRFGGMLPQSSGQVEIL